MKVTFRSDEHADFACLEEYLRSGEFGVLPDAWKHQAQQEISALNATAETVAASVRCSPAHVLEVLAGLGEVKLPTRYDSPLQARILDKVIERVRTAAESIGLDTTNFPHHACIPTGLVNASAVTLPCYSRAFLLFDSQLFLYCHLFAKAFSRCLPVVSRGDAVSLSVDITLVAQRLASTPDIHERLLDLLHAYAVNGSPGTSKQYTLEPEYDHFADIIRNGMELFVVAHEFGHVYAGHLSELLRRAGLHTEISAAENPSHRQEHEADLLGLLLTLHAMNSSGYDVALAYVGVDLFFVSLDMAERFSRVGVDGSEAVYSSDSTASHPSNKARREFLDDCLEGLVESRDQAAGAKDMVTRYAAIADNLWDMVKEANSRPL